MFGTRLNPHLHFRDYAMNDVTAALLCSDLSKFAEFIEENGGEDTLYTLPPEQICRIVNIAARAGYAMLLKDKWMQSFVPRNSRPVVSSHLPAIVDDHIPLQLLPAMDPGLPFQTSQAIPVNDYIYGTFYSSVHNSGGATERELTLNDLLSPQSECAFSRMYSMQDVYHGLIAKIRELPDTCDVTVVFVNGTNFTTSDVGGELFVPTKNGMAIFIERLASTTKVAIGYIRKEQDGFTYYTAPSCPIGWKFTNIQSILSSKVKAGYVLTGYDYCWNAEAVREFYRYNEEVAAVMTNPEWIASVSQEWQAYCAKRGVFNESIEGQPTVLAAKGGYIKFGIDDARSMIVSVAAFCLLV